MAAIRGADLILMDMSLPVHGRLGGHARAQGARGDPRHPRHRPDRPRDGRRREKALEAGCDDYDTKPVEFPRLLGKIEALLARNPAM